MMEGLLSIFETKPQEECVLEEQELRYLASKAAIWDHFGIPQAHYLALDTNEKSKMLNEYYKNYYQYILGMIFLDFFIWILAFFILCGLLLSVSQKSFVHFRQSTVWLSR